MENISPKLVKDIENSRFRSRSRDFYQFLEGFGIGFGEFGLGKKVSVSENLVSEKNSRYRFRSNFWYRHSVGQGGHLWDPMGPSGWFDESSDDS